ncbi:hypothetical protein DAEQUDRAFT_234890 [Daedalea quercina L-15889]|uniref:Uncharacterized protein n=1 Tax=Daedalea quercina L-15889 TaxID=1314783 RepID=A0A165QVP6_9APHY|nr:hypothetical protein DAEQUDRAFT_234890 [Daedalea quercina L-15889]
MNSSSFWLSRNLPSVGSQSALAGALTTLGRQHSIQFSHSLTCSRAFSSCSRLTALARVNTGSPSLWCGTVLYRVLGLLCLVEHTVRLRIASDVSSAECTERSIKHSTSPDQLRDAAHGRKS